MSYSCAFSQAIGILLYVHVKIQSEHYEYLSTKHISESLNIPAPTTVKVLQKLTAAGLLDSKTGADGGMALTKPIENICLYDVFNAVEQGKPLFKVQCNYNISGKVVEHAKAKMLSVINTTENNMHEYLKSISLMDLLS